MAAAAFPVFMEKPAKLHFELPYLVQVMETHWQLHRGTVCVGAT